MHARSQTVLFATLTVGTSVLLCFLFLEYVATYFLYADTQQNIDKEFDPVLGWRYKPGMYRVKPDSSFVSHRIHINELGLRGELPRKHSGRVRVIVLGDSFTFARQVRDEEMFTSQLEARLNDSFQDRYEVMNAGVEGYGTAQELLLMQELAKAGIVGNFYVLQVFTNDIMDNLRLDYDSLSTVPFRPGFVLGPEQKLHLEHAPEKDKWHSGAEERGTSLRTVRVVAAAAESYAQSRPALVRFAAGLGIAVSFPRMPGLIAGWYDEDVVRNGLPLMKELLREIKSEAERQQAKLLVLSMPSPLMVYPDTYRPILLHTFPNNAQVNVFISDVDKPARAVAQLCHELGVPLLDLYPILVRNNTKELYFPRDGHLQRAGHSIAADALAERIATILHH